MAIEQNLKRALDGANERSFAERTTNSVNLLGGDSLKEMH